MHPCAVNVLYREKVHQNPQKRNFVSKFTSLDKKEPDEHR